MPSEIVTGNSRVLEGSDAFLMARVVTADGSILVTGDVTAGQDVAVAVFDTDGATSGTAIFSESVAEGDGSTGPLFNTLQTDDFWGVDGTGYNWRHQLVFDSTGSSGPNLVGGKRYRVEFSVATDSFGTVRWVHYLDCVSMSSA